MNGKSSEANLDAGDAEMDDKEPSKFELGFDYAISEEFGMVQVGVPALMRSLKGAEARVTPCVFLGRAALRKERLPKTYRHPQLDSTLNKTRLRAELKGITKAKQVWIPLIAQLLQLGVDAPAVWFVDERSHSFIMERIEGPTAKAWIDEQQQKMDGDTFEATMKWVGHALGEKIGMLHTGSLIHGDLTTSNVMLRNGDPQKLVLIDFGLSSQGKILPENKGVDLYVLERALSSTHPSCGEQIFKAVLEGYVKTGKKQGEAVLKKLDEIRLRGRKRDMTG